jgi:isocitrate/isopropylmalate dehydrogenase
MRIAVIPGDGIGVETTAEAMKAVRAVADVFGRQFDLEMLPGAPTITCRPASPSHPTGGRDAPRRVRRDLIGALGDPAHPRQPPCARHPARTRFALDLYVNYRPVKLLDARLCPLKERLAADVNFVVFRENTEGLHVNIGGRFKA